MKNTAISDKAEGRGIKSGMQRFLGLFKGTHRLCVEKRASGVTGQVLFSRIVAIIGAAIIVGMVLLIALSNKARFGEALERVFINRFFTKNIAMALRDAVPLIIATFGIAVAFRMKLWNIGGHGQMIAGSMFAYGAWFYMKDLPAWALVPLMMLAAMLGGALCASVAAFTKTYLNVNETITTLMMNYIMVQLGAYMISLAGPWNAGTGFNNSLPIDKKVVLPMIGKSGVYVTVFIAVAIMLVYYLVMNKSRWGYEMRVTGENSNAAKYAGMPVKRNMVLALLISGAIAGLAGYCVLAGNGGQNGFAPSAVGDVGFTAVMVAWLARLNPWGIAAMSLFIAGITNGANSLQSFGVDQSIADFARGLILLIILAVDYVTRFNICIREKEPKSKNSADDTAKNTGDISKEAAK